MTNNERIRAKRAVLFSIVLVIGALLLLLLSLPVWVNFFIGFFATIGVCSMYYSLLYLWISRYNP